MLEIGRVYTVCELPTDRLYTRIEQWLLTHQGLEPALITFTWFKKPREYKWDLLNLCMYLNWNISDVPYKESDWQSINIYVKGDKIHAVRKT